jgi:hypothetical protein
MNKPTLVKVSSRDFYSNIPGDSVGGEAFGVYHHVVAADNAALKIIRDGGFTQHISTWVSTSPFTGLDGYIENAVADLMVKAKYKCEFIEGNSYYGVIPTGIFTKDASQYDPDIEDGWKRDMLLDPDYVPIDETPLFLGDVDESYRSAFLGHGVLFANNGHSGLHNGIIKLSNGDYLAITFWIWYNK